jgi:small-conductance mechanosensitive channel
MSTLAEIGSHRWATALAIAAIGTVVLVVVDWLIRRAERRLLPRLAASDAIDAARLQTVATLGRRFLIAILGTLVAWQALSVFPATSVVADTLLASSAVIALIVGFAVSAPLSNVGAGILLGIAQPVRLGDRTTIDGQAGTVERITLIYTVLRNDEGLAVYIPNARVVQAIIVNRTVIEDRAPASVRLPMRLGGDVATARQAILKALEDVEPRGEFQSRIAVAEVSAELVWLDVEALAPDGTSRTTLEAALREAVLDALGAAGLLPKSTA